MLHIVIGTRAQLIKMAPVLQELERRGAPFELLFTGQHSVTMHALLAEFEIQARPTVLYSGAEVKSIRQVPQWAFKVLRALRRLRLEAPVKTPGERDIYVVHGDTFSTLAGLYAGRRQKALVAHVESGLRSYDWRNPFPEELVRRITMRYCDIAFAPGEWAASNLAGHGAHVIDTAANTLLDTVRFALKKNRVDISERHGVLFSIHRFETLYSDKRIRLVTDLAMKLADEVPVTFVLHPSTEHRLRERGLLADLEANRGITLLPRMTYIPFISRAACSQLVVTDGGSNQEELSYLGVPTLLMRQATERQEGIGDNVLLGQFDMNRVMAFVDQALGRVRGPSSPLADIHPSRSVVEYLLSAQAEVPVAGE